MQLTIDTQKDSHNEIRKAIRMLMSLVGEKDVYTNEAPKEGIFSSGSDTNSAANAFVDMFDTVKKDDSPAPDADNKEDDSSVQFY